MHDYKEGERVFWVDPDMNVGSGPGTIVSVQHQEDDAVIALEMDSGSTAEVYAHELHRLGDERRDRLLDRVALGLVLGLFVFLVCGITMCSGTPKEVEIERDGKLHQDSTPGRWPGDLG